LEFDAAVTTLLKNGCVYTKDFVLGNQMPEPDRGNYIVQEGITIATKLNEEYDESDGTLTPISFLMKEDTIKEVRKELVNVSGVTAPEASGFQLFPLIQGMHQTTEAKVMKKYEARTKQGIKLVPRVVLQQGMKRKAPTVEPKGSPSKKEPKTC
jgi:hypothetical protein